MKRKLHINLFINSRGHHEASWRHPDASPLPLTDIQYYHDLAQRAEEGLFDSIFLADQLAARDDALVSRAPAQAADAARKKTEAAAAEAQVIPRPRAPPS